MSAPIDLAALRDLLFADVFCEGHLPEPGIDADEQRTKYCDGSCRHLPSQRNPHATMFAAIREMARRDWAVRVLDALDDDVPGHLGPPVPTRDMKRKPAQRWRVFGAWTKAGVRACHYGPTPDAARLAAAQAVWPDLKKSLTSKQIAAIGECP